MYCYNGTDLMCFLCQQANILHFFSVVFVVLDVLNCNDKVSCADNNVKKMKLPLQCTANVGGGLIFLEQYFLVLSGNMPLMVPYLAV